MFGLFAKGSMLVTQISASSVAIVSLAGCDLPVAVGAVVAMVTAVVAARCVQGS